MTKNEQVIDPILNKEDTNAAQKTINKPVVVVDLPLKETSTYSEPLRETMNRKMK